MASTTPPISSKLEDETHFLYPTLSISVENSNQKARAEANTNNAKLLCAPVYMAHDLHTENTTSFPGGIIK